jgi:hypothetical protein
LLLPAKNLPLRDTAEGADLFARVELAARAHCEPPRTRSGPDGILEGLRLRWCQQSCSLKVAVDQTEFQCERNEIPVILSLRYIPIGRLLDGVASKLGTQRSMAAVQRRCIRARRSLAHGCVRNWCRQFCVGPCRRQARRPPEKRAR